MTELRAVDDRAGRFDALLTRVEAPLRRSLAAAYGPDMGREAAADALAYAWEHLDRIEAMDNPGGYLWRVGQTSVRAYSRRAQREARWRRRQPERAPFPAADASDPGLVAALRKLTHHQRAAIVLVHGYGYPLADAAATIECSVSTLRNHLARALAHLRADLGGPDA